MQKARAKLFAGSVAIMLRFLFIKLRREQGGELNYSRINEGRVSLTIIILLLLNLFIVPL